MVLIIVRRHTCTELLLWFLPLECPTAVPLWPTPACDGLVPFGRSPFSLDTPDFAVLHRTWLIPFLVLSALLDFPLYPLS